MDNEITEKIQCCLWKGTKKNDMEKNLIAMAKLSS